jgi:disintegrin and metalloproteinase domain-containing protein 10
VLGDNESYVHGSISDGVFHGKIITSKDAYYIEKAHYYFPNHSHVDDGFHSVIYKDKHVDDPYRNQRTVHPNGCGLTHDIKNWMDRIQNSGEDENNEDDQEEIEVVPLAHDDDSKDKINATAEHKQQQQLNDNHYYHVNNNRIYDEDESPHEKYSKEANSRNKRATGRYQERNTCSLYIQTDPLIWRHIRESIPDVNIKIYV